MGQTNPSTAELLQSSAGQIVSKLGMVLAHTKDALLKDLLGDIQNYLPQVTDPDNYTFEAFKASLKSGETPIGKFIEALFTRLGYDLTEFQESKELTDNIRAIIATTFSLGEALKKLFDGQTDWMGEAEKFAKNAAKPNGSGQKVLPVDELFSDFDASKVGAVSIGGHSLDLGDGSNQISALLRMILDLITLVRKFTEIEWDKIKKENDKLFKFLKDTYFDQKFAERILNHVLVVMLRNAREVFADDIDAIVDHIDQARAKIVAQAEDEVKGQIDTILDQIKTLRQEIKTLETQIEAEAKRLRDEALALKQEVVGEVSAELQTRLKVARAKFDKLAGEALGDYNRLGKTFSQLYAVLDFLQVIEKETIAVAKYIPGAPSIPTIDLNAVNALIKQANGVATAANQTAEQINKQIDAATKELASMCPTVEIYVLRWTNLEKLCSDPIAYFQTLYPIKDYDDAEKLLGKILNVVRAFNSDVPDLGSLKGLLFEFLVRIKDRIKDQANPLADDLKRTFAQFESFILDLLKVLEKFAVGVKKELTAAYNDFTENKESLIGQLKTGITTAVAPLKDANGKIKNFTIPDSNIKFKRIGGVNYNDIKGYLKPLFADPLIRTIAEKAKQHELFSGITPEEWKTAIEKSIQDNAAQNIIREYQAVLGEMEQYVTALFSEERWKAKFDDTIKALKDEFARQTANVPDNFDALKDFGRNSIDRLARGEALDNPFSEFDFTAYFTILSDRIKAMVPDNPDIYFAKLRETTAGSMKALMSSSQAGFNAVRDKAKAISTAEYEARLRDFAVDVFTAYWAELKQSLYKTLVRPFIAVLEQAVKDWVREVLVPKIVGYVQQNIINELNFNEYKAIFDEVETFEKDAKQLYDKAQQTAGEVKEWADTATRMVTDLLMLVPEAKEVDSWNDGLQFALKLYKVIPPKVKNYLRELIDLPDWNFEGVRLPDYSLDVKNKFLAVTLYEYPGKNAVKKADFTADVSIRLVAFVGDRKVTDTAGKVKKDADGDEIVQSGLYLLPVIRGNFGADFNVGKSHHLLLGAAAALNPEVTAKSTNDPATKTALESDTFGFFFTTKEGELFPSAELLCSENALSAYLELLFKRGQAGSPVVKPLDIFKSGIADLSVGDYPQKLFLGYSGGFDVGYQAGLRNLLFKLRLHQINDFFAMILSNDIEIEIEKLDLIYSLKKGFQFDGEYRLRIPIKADIDLSVIKFTNLNLELGSGDLRNVMVKMLTNFTVDFQGIALSFAEMGLGVDINYMKPDGGFGDLRFAPELQFPTGISVAVDLAAVKGAGLIRWDKQKEEFLGAVDLTVLDMCSVGALLLFNMKMPDGSQGFSFMGAISFVFPVPIQLSMGFALSAIGGSLGVNRRIETEKLRDAVRDGSLGTILFVRDLAKNLDTVLANVTFYYPVQKDQFFFGFLAQITWTDILKADLGIFIQAPDPVTIMIAGGIHISIADQAESLLAINVYFMGGINFDKGLFFDASLVDSRVVGIDLYGDMALRIYWAGDTRGFLLSAGGFHPQFKPEAGFNVGRMRRLGMKLDYGILKLSLESYFALTSNTVQFGAAVLLKVGWDKFGLTGHLNFDALFHFSPFSMLVDISAGIAIKCGSWTLSSVHLSMSLSGPAPWNAKGKAKFKFLFFTIKVGFDETWGKKQSIGSRKYIEVLQLYSKNFYETSNWKVIAGDMIEGQVSIFRYEEQSLVMQPSDRLSFTQSAVPFDQEMVRYGEAKPGDARKITLSGVTVGGQNVGFEQTRSSFAPTLIRELKDNEKLKAPSYENMAAGFELTTGFGVEKGAGCEASAGYEIKCQPVNWDEWERETAAPATTRSVRISRFVSPVKGPGKVVRPPAIVDARRRTDIQRFSGKVEQAPLTRVSFRRSADGFKRYTLELDQLMNKPLDRFIAELDDNLNK